jgi:hypothetical protein
MEIPKTVVIVFVAGAILLLLGYILSSPTSNDKTPSNDGSYQAGIRGGGKGGAGFKVFTYSDHVVSRTGATIVLGNAVGRQITYFGASVNNEDCSPQTPTQIGPNSILTITCSSDISGGLDPGGAYNFPVTIRYTDSQSGLEHTDTGGFVKGNIE